MAEANEQPIIIRKVKGGGHAGHHGGAWKVAYADFVTAMMAFFLLLWLLNATTEEQRKGIADYFSPDSVSNPNSGSGGILGGQTISVEGNRVAAGGPGEGGLTIPLPPEPAGDGEGGLRETEEILVDGETPPDEDGTGMGPGAADDATGAGQAEKPSEQQLAELLAKREQEQFDAAEAALHQAIQSVPDLATLQESLIIEQTPEGMRIQLVDQEGYSMFALGSAKPNEQMKRLVGLITQVVAKLPNRLSISGHTDSRPYRAGHDYTNWELSSDRANAARRLLIDEGLEQERIKFVQGRAANDPLLPDEPTNARNRRISIVLLRENPAPENFNSGTPGGGAADAGPAAAPEPKGGTPGPAVAPARARGVSPTIAPTIMPMQDARRRPSFTPG